MKKTIYAFAVISSMFLVACGSDNAEGSDESGEKKEQSGGEEKEDASGPSIAGEWQLSDFDMGMEIPEEQKAMFDEMMEEMKANTTMTFNADGTFSSKQSAMGEVTEESGTYKLDGNKLTTTSNGKTESLDVELKDNTMTIKVEDRGQTMTMTFTKK